MPAGPDRRFFLRLGALLVLGILAIVGAQVYRRSMRRKPPSPEVQQEGLRLVRDILARVGATPFGASQRGVLLTRTIESFLRRGRVVFTAELAPQALYRREAGGYEELYVKVLRVGRQFAHQPAEQIAEGIFHEAVHARKSRAGGSSIDEECDGYAAGLCAGAAVAGRSVPDVLPLDGRPVAEFVRQAYPDLSRDPAYQPVGESREWLVRRTGLR